MAQIGLQHQRPDPTCRINNPLNIIVRIGVYSQQVYSQRSFAFMIYEAAVQSFNQA